jgi:hypothetical protein
MMQGRTSRPVRARNGRIIPPGTVVRVVAYVIEADTPDDEVWVGEAVQEDFTEPASVEAFLKSKPAD